MKLLLDEMHSPVVADALNAEGLGVTAVAGTPELRGRADADLLDYAAGQEQALVTENVADFGPLAGEWATEGRVHAGLIFTSPRRFNRASLAYPGDLIAALRQFLVDAPGDSGSWVWWL